MSNYGDEDYYDYDYGYISPAVKKRKRKSRNRLVFKDVASYKSVLTAPPPPLKGKDSKEDEQIMGVFKDWEQCERCNKRLNPKYYKNSALCSDCKKTAIGCATCGRRTKLCNAAYAAGVRADNAERAVVAVCHTCTWSKNLYAFHEPQCSSRYNSGAGTPSTDVAAITTINGIEVKLFECADYDRY